MEERKLKDRSLRDLIETIQFTENVSTKIHGLQNEAEIYKTVTRAQVKICDKGQT